MHVAFEQKHSSQKLPLAPASLISRSSRYSQPTGYVIPFAGSSRLGQPTTLSVGSQL